MFDARPVVLQQLLPEAPMVALAIVVLIVAIPPLLFMAYLRAAERNRREPWSNLLKAFAWGGTIGVVIAIVPQFFFQSYADALYPLVQGVTFATVVIAPVTEELAKGLGLLFVRDRDPEPEDGYVYGGVVGLGFAATENLLYVTVALVMQGQDVALLTAVYRGIVTVSLHGTTSALAGAGIWAARWRGAYGRAAMLVVVAIVIHAAYNALVSLSFALAVLLAGAGAVFAFVRIRRRVRRLDGRASD